MYFRYHGVIFLYDNGHGYTAGATLGITSKFGRKFLSYHPPYNPDLD